jgi:hypothetical protein
MGEKVLLAIIGLIFFGITTSCMERTIYLDYDVIFEDVSSVNQWVGDPVLIPGIYEEQLFNEVEEGDDLYIIHGFQGGIWVHLSIRVGGLDSSGVIYAKLGDDIGEIYYNIKLVRTAEGYLEAYDIPVPVSYAEEELQSLYDTESYIQIQYTSGDETLTVTRTIMLREG